MGGNRIEDRELDALLTDSLACDARPSAAAVAGLKRQLDRERTKSRSLSLWWLPALAGTAVSACLVYALSFLADRMCLSIVMIIAGAFVLCAWLLTIIGVYKYESFWEACKLI